MDIQEASWNTAARTTYHAEHPENFAGPDMSFPIKDGDDVHSAWNLAGHADDPDAVRAKIKAIAGRMGLADSLPDTAKDFEAATPVSTLTEALIPRTRIATIQVCFIEDNAVSLNGRIYPAETVDKLIASGQRKLLDSNALPMTCFLSHEDADNDRSSALVGKITSVRREGTKGIATIDLADTSSARDLLGLITGSYLCTESLRASNAELKAERGYDAPIVCGNPVLEGIDFTSYPGLAQVARIQHVQIAESATPPSAVTDVFHTNLARGTLMTKKIEEAHTVLTEVAGGNMPTYTPASGNTVGVTSGPTQDTYGQRMYQEPHSTAGEMQGMETVPELQEAHDRVAMVQGRACAPGKETARWAIAYMGMLEEDRSELREKGRKISAMHDSHLDKAHDAIAKHTKMACEGAQNKYPAPPAKGKVDPDHDGDDDSTNDPQKNPDFGLDKMESKKASSPMTKEEALKLLEAEGYDVATVVKKKTDFEKLQEAFVASQAENARQLEEMRSQLQPVATLDTTVPQRRSQVSGVSAPANGSIRSSLYRHGNYLKEQIRKADWEGLADRTCPIPENLNIDNLIKEFEQLYALQYDDRFQILSATELR